MKRFTTILAVIAFTTVWISCSKSIIVKPDNLSFNGITLYPNHTYDIIYAEMDVGGVILNFGKYHYQGDTLILESNADEYINQLTKPVPIECDEGTIYLHFKEYLSPFDNSSYMSMYWFDISVMGILNDNDTINIWKANSIASETNLDQIKLSTKDLGNLEKIWIEIYDTPTTEPIQLPKDYKCLNITIPVINVIEAQLFNEKVM